MLIVINEWSLTLYDNVFLNVYRYMHKNDRNACTAWHQLDNRKCKRHGLVSISLKKKKDLEILGKEVFQMIICFSEESLHLKLQ